MNAVLICGEGIANDSIFDALVPTDITCHSLASRDDAALQLQAFRGASVILLALIS